MQLSTISFVVASIILSSFGQLCLKIGVLDSGLSLNTLLSMRTLTDKYLLAGVILYGAAAVSWLLALTKAELSVVYPLLGASYIITSLLAVFFLHETVTVTRWAGIALVVVGVILIGRS